jgi:hypothetical protein
MLSRADVSMRPGRDRGPDVKREQRVGEDRKQADDIDEDAHDFLRVGGGLERHPSNLCDPDHRTPAITPNYSSSDPGVGLSMRWPKAEAIGFAGSSCQACASNATMRLPCLTIETRAKLSSARPERR